MTETTEDLTDPEGAEPAAASGPNPYAEIPPTEVPAAVRSSRRPMSLRAALDEQAEEVASGPSPPGVEFATVAEQAIAEPADSNSSALDPVFERLATAQDRAAAFAVERPEVVVGAAFIGGLIFATILKRLGRR